MSWLSEHAAVLSLLLGLLVAVAGFSWWLIKLLAHRKPNVRQKAGDNSMNVVSGKNTVIGDRREKK